MTAPKTSKQKAVFVITTLADVGSIFMSLFYIAFVGLMMLLDVGLFWVNCVMVGITALYIGFVFFKLVYLNRVMQRTARMKRIVKISQKYTKFALRIIGAAFVVLSIIGNTIGVRSAIAIFGIVFMCISLAVSIFVDIVSLAIRWNVKQVLASRAGNKQQLPDTQYVEAYGEEVKV